MESSNSVDILIKNGIVVTMEDQRFLEDGALFIEDDRIRAVGRSEEIVRSYRADHVIDAQGKIVLPGFINCHTHTDGDTLMRSSEPDHTGYRDFIDYLTNFKWPMLLEMKPEDHYIGALLGYLESAKAGTTLLADNYYAPRGADIEGVPRAAREVGIRTALVRGYHDYQYLIPGEFIESTESLLQEYSRLHRKWNNAADGRIRVWIGAVNLLYNSLESIRTLSELAVKLGTGIHSHVAEVKRGCDVILERHGKGYVEVLDEIGVLGPMFQAAHCVWLSDKEIGIMAARGATAVHNPASNMVLTDGVAPIPKMLKAGVRVTLGTDGLLDMLHAMRLAACLHKVVTMDPDVLDAMNVLRMATIEGARAFGLERELGSLKVGKKADIVLVDLKKPHIAPIYDPLVALVYFAQGCDVSTVIVDGKIIVENGNIKTVDEEHILEKAQKAKEGLLARVSLRGKR